MQTILVTGGTGMIGAALTKALLDKGYRVIILSRDAQRKTAEGNVSFGEWNVKKQSIDQRAIESADHIIHLAGAGIADKRWTIQRKQEIADSRIKGGELIVQSLKTISNNVKSVISASAIGWYGPDPVIPNAQPFMENAPAFDDFLGQTCKAWEDSIAPVASLGKRLVTLRTGIVLSSEGGALQEFRKPLRFGFATILGDGKQMISWIHIDDLVNLYIHAIENEDMRGVYNAVAPKPVSNKKLVLQLARTRKGKFFIPVYVPSFVLKGVLGEMSIEVLKSATVSSTKLQHSGFVYSYPDIAAALTHLKKPE
jgi:uncharacterized protein (TIGR01777 family)